MTRPTKYSVSQSELEENGVPIRRYTQRRNKGWTHEQALQPVNLAYSRRNTDDPERRRVAVGPTYSIADHIAVRRLSRDGVSLAGLQRQFPHICVDHLEAIVNGHNY